MNLLKVQGIIYCATLIVLVVIVHPAQTANIFKQDDLAGTWESHSLASGPGAPWYERATIIVNPDGSFTATTIDSNGETGNLSGTLNISADGIITFDSTEDDMRCTMDMGKTVITCTDTWSTGSPGTTEIKVWVKKARPYSLADFAGTWEVQALASGPGAPWWVRGPVVVEEDGSSSWTMEEYNSDPDIVSRDLDITPDGIITSAETKDDFRCAMDAGKTVIACTNTWSTWSPETTDIYVWLKKAQSLSQKPMPGILLLLLEE